MTPVSVAWTYALGNTGGSITAMCESTSPGTHSTELGINMRDGTSATEDTKSAGMSPLRLRVGVFLILLWLVPFWALSPYIAHSLSALSNPPSVAEVTTAILVMQTIFGLLGLWVAGTEVKAIVKGSTKRHAIAAIWSIFLHGEIRDPGNNGSDHETERPPPDGT